MGEYAGVDFGSSLTKFAWYKDDKLCFATPNYKRKLDLIVSEMITDGVKSAIATGINDHDRAALAPIQIFDQILGDQIQNEIELQARGARKLLEIEGKTLDSFLVVSIGTGTSYTFVRDEKIERFPFGHALGAGFIDGVLTMASIGRGSADDPNLTAFGPYRAEIMDTLIEDVSKKMKGTFVGSLPIAHFGKMDGGGMRDAIVTAINCTATAVVRDIAMFAMMPEWLPPKDVVFLGTITERSSALREILEHKFVSLGQNFPNWNHQLIFPRNATYAGALGALEFGK